MRHTHNALGALAALALALPLGCGDDDGGTPDATTGGSLVVVDRSPGEGEELWLGDAGIEITFNEPLAADSVDADSVVVSGPDGPLAITRSVSGATLRLTLDEPPVLPADLKVELGAGVRSADGDDLTETSWTVRAPLWYEVASFGADPAPPSVVALEARLMAAAWVAEGRVHTATVSVSGESLGGDAGWDGQEQGPAVSGRVVLREGEGSPYVAFVSEGQVMVGSGAASAEAVPGSDGADAVGLAVDQGSLVVAWNGPGGIEARRREDGGSWQALGEPLAVAATHIDLASTSAGLLLVHDGGERASALRWSGDAWEAFGAPLGGPQASSPVLAPEAGAAPHVAWLDSGSAQVASWDGSAWQPLGALELDPDSSVLAPPALAADADGALWASWVETGAAGSRAYVARRIDDRWRVHGGAVMGWDEAHATGLVLDGDQLSAVVAGDSALAIAHWNRSPALPYGQVGGDIGSCAIPSAPAALLSETGCYADVDARELVAGAIPYGVRAPLWSDGAFKRRFFILPEGETIGYAATGPWTWPVGAILIKEFWLERVEGDPSSRFPVETRFWVKRCEYGDCIEPWQGYSYQWNQDGSDAELLDGFTTERVDWTVSAGGEEVTRTHIHPSRFECIQCHTRPAGYVLGLRAGQLAGSFDYGNAVDRQLRALAHAGVFGDSLDEAGGAAAAAWPAPGDPGAPLEGRVRAYLDANCAHCHKRDLTGDELPGEAPVMDLRFSTPLADTGLCDMVEPGDPAASRLHEVTATRGDGQMPPLGTDLPDTDQLAVTAAWIEAMEACP